MSRSSTVVVISEAVKFAASLVLVMVEVRPAKRCPHISSYA
jgi:hypothetical protein